MSRQPGEGRYSHAEREQRWLLTNMHITESEFNSLTIPPSNALMKTRFRLTTDGCTFAIDKFEGCHIGLILAEYELAKDESRVDTPFTAVREVTDDDAYSGGALALAVDEEIRRILP